MAVGEISHVSFEVAMYTHTNEMYNKNEDQKGD